MAASNLFPPMDSNPEPYFSDKSIEPEEGGSGVKNEKNEKDLPKEKADIEDEMKDHEEDEDDDEDLEDEEGLDDEEDDLDEDEEDLDSEDEIEECCQEHFRRLEEGNGLEENDQLNIKDCCAEVYKGFKSFGLKWFKFKQFRRMNGQISGVDEDDISTDEDTDEVLSESPEKNPESSMDPLESSREHSPGKSFEQDPDDEGDPGDDEDPDPSSFLETSLTEDVDAPKIGDDDDDDLEIMEVLPAPSPKSKYWSCIFGVTSLKMTRNDKFESDKFTLQ